MSLVSDGLSNREVGQLIDITRGTIGVHLYNIYKKLRINNRTALAKLAAWDHVRLIANVTMPSKTCVGSLVTFGRGQPWCATIALSGNALPAGWVKILITKAHSARFDALVTRSGHLSAAHMNWSQVGAGATIIASGAPIRTIRHESVAACRSRDSR